MAADGGKIRKKIAAKRCPPLPVKRADSSGVAQLRHVISNEAVSQCTGTTAEQERSWILRFELYSVVRSSRTLEGDRSEDGTLPRRVHVEVSSPVLTRPVHDPGDRRVGCSFTSRRRGKLPNLVQRAAQGAIRGLHAHLVRGRLARKARVTLRLSGSIR